MLKNGFSLGVLLLIVSMTVAAEPVSSGPQPGEKVPGPFKPLNVTGPDAGQEECLYCKNGSRPVVMVFTRDLSPAVVALIKKLDEATGAKRDSGLASCVIVLCDHKDIVPMLAKWAKAEKLDSTVLATYPTKGPEKYSISPDAAVTVLLYSKQTVKANHTFRTGELKDAGVDAVMADLAKIMPRE
jgi:hypothetical protein